MTNSTFTGVVNPAGSKLLRKFCRKVSKIPYSKAVQQYSVFPGETFKESKDRELKELHNVLEKLIEAK